MQGRDGARQVGGTGFGAVASFVIALAITGAARRLGPASRREGPDPRAADDPTSSADPGASARQTGRGREADAPTQIPVRGWRDIVMRVYEEIGRDRIVAVAAGVTFYGLLALFPAVAAFVSLYGLLSDPATISDHLASLSGLLPGGAVDIVSDQVKRITSKGDTALGFAFFSGLAVSLWSSNAGMKAVFDALNVAYNEEERRNFFWLNVWSLGFTLATVLFGALALSAVVLIPIVLKFVGLGALTEWIVWIGRWPALLALTVTALALLYRFGPSRAHPRWRWISPGATVAALGWMIASMLFSWYVSSFGNYNETYGSLGAVIGFMTWLWISTTILLVGAELNAETEHQTAQDTTSGRPAPLGARGANMADTIGATR